MALPHSRLPSRDAYRVTLPSTRPQYRGRFAPSPTGPLHFGSLVAALGSCLDARSQGGEWRLRMEDLDPPRERPGAAESILRTLDRFGFEWDGPVLYQSRRQAAYHEALHYLLAHELAYPCACSRRQVLAAGLRGVEGPRYPGTCRNGLPAGAPARAVRDRVEGRITFPDRICGTVTQDLPQEIGDFIVRRADGLYAYQLAVVVDDAFQGITHVVRGADLLSSTPRQIHLQRQLGLPTPEYAHLPLVLDAGGRKLSKQSQARPVREEEPLPVLWAALKFLGQPLPSERPESLDAFWKWAIGQWDISRIDCPGDAHRHPVSGTVPETRV